MKSKQSIAELAYKLWIARGRPHGSEEEDWLEAERQLSAREDAPAAARSDLAIDDSLRESFASSQPPANHMLDAPLSNATEKWDATTSQANQARSKASSRIEGHRVSKSKVHDEGQLSDSLTSNARPPS
jgi:hypothetical protein